MSLHHDAAISKAAPVPAIRYEAWKGRIQMAMDIDELVRVVREYLAQWHPEELAVLPVEVGAGALGSSADIPARAVLAARAELKFHGTPGTGLLLREMSLALTAAAMRLRYLTSIRSREGA